MGRGRWDPQLADEPLEWSVPSVDLLKDHSAIRREQFWTRYFTSSTNRTVSPTLMGATRPDEVITGTAGEGTAVRPRNWNEDLKQKNKYSKNNDKGRGMRDGRTKGAQHTETYVKGHDATRKRVGLPRTQSGTDTHQWGKYEVRRN